jgi:AAA15 family ATPase/GTPase
MIASSRKDEDHALLAWPSDKNREVLPVAVIYGANASGKSAILDALETMRSHIRNSHRRDDPEGGMGRSAFLLDTRINKQPTMFECDFVDDGERFNYGFEISDTRVVKEWLNAFPNGRRQSLFQRNRQNFRFSRFLSGQKSVISRLTRPNSLFLSAGAQNDHELLTRVSTYFTSWRGHLQAWVPGAQASEKLGKESLDPRIIKFLSRLGTGVVEHRIRSEQIPKELANLSIELNEFLEEKLKKLNKGKRRKEKLDAESLSRSLILEFGHRASDGNVVFFDLDQESDGTRRLLTILHEAFKALDEGSLLVIDELDANLHTYACFEVLKLFLSKKGNPKGAQLIATTHDTNLLNARALRRDAIWFTDKTDHGATELSSLADFQTRSTDNFERGYLQGRFGGVPSKALLED